MSISDKISIIVPVYNSSKCIQMTIDSILAQTYKDFELILVNDGSTDDSGKICEEYTKTDNRVLYFSKTNGGVSSARNYGIEKANGKWVTFVDSDDYLCPEFLKTLINETLKFDYDIVISTGRHIKKDDLLQKGIEAAFKIDGMNELSARNLEECKEKFIKLDEIPMVLGPVWNKLFKRELIILYGIHFIDIESEDELFNIQYMCCINSFRSIKYSGYCYIDYPNSRCKQTKNIAEINWINLVWKYYEILKDRFSINNEYYWDRIYWRMLLRYSSYIRKGYFKSTRISYIKRIERWKEITHDSNYKRIKWKHATIPSAKLCYILSKYKLFYIGDLILLLVDGNH